MIGLDFKTGKITPDYDCGFSKLPRKIKKKVEGWCETAIEWTATKVHQKVLKVAFKAVRELLDRRFGDDGEEHDEEQ